MHQKEIKLRDQQIEELTKDREEVQIQREKRVQLIQERDFLLQKLNEKQTMIKVGFLIFTLDIEDLFNRRIQPWKLIFNQQNNKLQNFNRTYLLKTNNIQNHSML
jgi:hypothetical protein